MDAARDTEPDQPEPEQPAELPDVQTIVALMDKLTAMVETIAAERAATPITWLTTKQVAYRGCIGYQGVRKWIERGKIVSKRSDDGDVLISEASVDAHLANHGKKPRI